MALLLISSLKHIPLASSFTAAHHRIITTAPTLSAAYTASNTSLLSSDPSSRKIMMSNSSPDTQNDEHQGLADIGNEPHKQKVDNNSNNNNGMKTWKEHIDISIAKSRKIRGSNYVQISTMDYTTMEPRCRTVVFRGFMKDLPFGAVKEVLRGDDDDDSTLSSSSMVETAEKYTDCVMKMITDIRSNKVKEVQESLEMMDKKKCGNTVEMVWWFPKSSEQYRIRGKLQFIGNDGSLNNSAGSTSDYNDYFIGERKQQWGNLSDMAREQFYWDKPGIPYCTSKGHEQGVPPGGRDDEGKVLPVPDTFLLMLLYPTKIDYLKLGENYRQIDEWKWNDGDDNSQWEQVRMNP